MRNTKVKMEYTIGAVPQNVFRKEFKKQSRKVPLWEACGKYFLLYSQNS